MRKNKQTAILLAFFGGIIGLHKFYLRDIGGGIFYLFFFFFMSGIIKFPITFFLGFIAFDKVWSTSPFGFLLNRIFTQENSNYLLDLIKTLTTNFLFC